MKTWFIAFALLTASLSSTGAFAATKLYQVTGPVLEVSDSSITVEKGKEKWVMAKDANTKATGEIKVGTKVTVEYSMTAATITAKEEKPAKK